MLKSQLPTYSQQRKDDHVEQALTQQQQHTHSQFESIRFVHHSFAPLAIEDISISTEWANHQHTLPFYINGMTGGSEKTKHYNQQLAQLAHHTGLAMASGSVSGALSDSSVADSFTIIRKENPNGFVMANLGAHHSVENAKRAVDLLQANALQIHLNVPQEIVMPEGDRNFKSWLPNIEAIVKSLDVPIIVKEVGFGMSQETIQQLINVGVTTIDISGRGGTNFIAIENHRRDHLDFQSLINWGQTTPEALLEASPYMDKTTILASGGINDFSDIIKALALGAQAVGLSGRFLHMVHTNGVEKSIIQVNEWTEAIQQMMLLLGARTIKDLHQTDLVLPPELAHWAQARGIDWQQFAVRSQKKLL
ncbi:MULTISPECIES: type 2 isopentenyl-diphosphate Delta-isomerase [unclassified Facklamia]|uniref:type 2 isopentenyl-diphosphate Delta-isomerase n=1 Tax=Aerococcaceae TaxID=186827 RepID=UPI0013BE54CA|nr:MULTISPECIES: type 2 isopentenyl-diphosphate Delta-isomerase [unclassified Facklamia]NEW64666.1 type 2 isopentenyl-diphosphate Delta-isomerase [Facklamia sp. 252]NEW67991.1 type 2 isopentenyl-diphosphate Delta-isomerase [Facklamia sp. 253]QQD65069.1 type 2 isopentenyl-diphosphate Delta-isomerase [Aerococcaceae bacterium zg-252]